MNRELPKGWRKKKISEFTDVITGGTPSTSIDEYWRGGKIPWLRSGEMKDCFLHESKDHITKSGLMKSSARMMPKNTVAIALTGATTGKVALLKFESSANQSVTGISPSKEHLSEFIFYYLIFIRNNILHKSYGQAQRHISQGFVKKIEVLLPPIVEQKKIIQEIEKQFTRLDETIKNLKSIKEKLEVYRKAVLKKTFEKKENWEENKISNIFLSNPSKQEIKDLPDNLKVSFVPMKFISKRSKKIIDKEIKKISEVKKGYTYFKEGDILFAKITPCMENGKIAIAKELTNQIGFGSTEFHIFRSKGNMIKEYLFYFFQTETFRSGAKRNMTGTAGQLRVPIKFIEKYLITYPKSLDEQQKIVKQIESKFSIIEKLETTVNKSLLKSEQLRKSILKIAFEGRLVKNGKR